MLLSGIEKYLAFSKNSIAGTRNMFLIFLQFVVMS